MLFKNPEILYALFLLVIPILIHLFQLRRFKKTPFTNVAFLETVIQNTRKSSSLKKWLILATRLLAIACLVIAFAGPYIPATNLALQSRETLIFIDNSFSMQATGKKGDLLTEAKQDVLANLSKDENYTIATWDDVLRDFNPVADRNELLELDFAATSSTPQNLLLKLNNLFSNTQTAKQLLLISDFQDAEWSAVTDSTDNAQHLVKLVPTSLENYALDSISLQRAGNNYDLEVFVKSNQKTTTDIPVSLFNKNELIAKGSAKFEDSYQAVINFQIDSDEAVEGRLSITDAHLKFDNNFYFSINKTEPLKVLAISNASDAFLQRLYQSEEFQYTGVAENQLDYSLLSDQNLIILNEPKTIPQALINLLQQHTQDGGTLILIPDTSINPSAYNKLLNTFGLSGFKNLEATPQRITTINFDHPLYKNVFTGRSTNLQTHQVEGYFPLETSDAILSLENKRPFLAESNNLFVFTSSLSLENSNFINGQLIVPTFDKIALEALQLPQTHYTINSKNTFEVSTSLPQDAVLTLEKNGNSLIPMQQRQGQKISISTQDGIVEDGLYALKSKQDTLAVVAFNYARAESVLTENAALVSTENTTIPNLFNKLEQDTNLNLLYKWFVIFALLAFLAEMLILKLFK